MCPDVVPLTKIRTPPLRGATVARAALEQRMADALRHCRLLTLAAPAGFGKTTAVARQLSLLPAGSAQAWVSADRGEDLAGLVASLWAALAPAGVHRPRQWAAAPPAAEAQQAAPSHRLTLAAAFQDALAATAVACGVIVIDDAHRIADPGAWGFLDALLRRLPAPWTLVLASRREPMLSLPWLRATGELAEFGGADLAFTGAELPALASARGALGRVGHVDAASSPLGGWAAALVLALSGTGAHERSLQDYFTAEVLGSLPEAVRHFALRAAVLCSLEPADCNMLLGRKDATERLDELAAWGLLAGDGSGRLLPPFRSLLLAQLHREAPAEARALEARAGQLGLPAGAQTALHASESSTTRTFPVLAGSAGAAPVGVARPSSGARAEPDAPAAAALQTTPAMPAPATSPAEHDRAALLSAREREVLARIASGDSNKLIARAFSLSPHTVKRHVANILDKLMLSSRVQAAAWHAAQQERETA